ncbi:MAG: spore coat protein [Clostridia bacterium]|nr:spore coat protein [Clostridia bacterium]MDD4798194.1 spore coat protein [Clostridia bacterium]
MQLSQKETSLLKELKDQEKLCVEKYNKHASAASDQQLKSLFTQIAQSEQTHYNTITQIENGTVPQMSGSSSSSAQPTFNATYSAAENTNMQNDCYLCTDLLSGEKHVSQLYNTCIFEFKNEGIRNALNHIQKEEQEHGKMIYDYMAANNMYS